MSRKRWTVALAVAVALGTNGVAATTSSSASSPHARVMCEHGSAACPEIADSERAFGHYVGHDEPATLFYSSQAGSGNRMRYGLTLPTDPPPSPLTPTKSFSFQQNLAFWFGMAMCNTQSEPRPLGPAAHPINPGIPCRPDSDTNIHENSDPSASDALIKHPGTDFMELQFYPPGWVPWPGGASCAARRWCTALTITGASFDDLHGTAQNPTCQAIASVQPQNFAFVTKSGIPHPDAPPNPVESTLSTITPNPSTDLFMNPGDRILITLQDTAHGLRVDLDDVTAGTHGSMTASAANRFGQVEYNPTGSTCRNLPYDFHPMYSTSSEQTRVPWAAHSYNVSFSGEIGHFDYCYQPRPGGLFGGSCSAAEGAVHDTERTDGDDNFCFPNEKSSLVQVSGCLDSNVGFDGTSYIPLWPDGSADHPTPITFSSPQTGSAFDTNYSRMAFETDLPSIEQHAFSPANHCDDSGAGCVIPPRTDDGQRAAFYPFFTAATGYGDACDWTMGNVIPGHTTNAFGRLAQYGSLLKLNYPYGPQGSTLNLAADFRQVLSTNPCQG